MSRITVAVAACGLLLLAGCANSGLLETESAAPDVLGNFSGNGRSVRVEVRHTADWAGTTFNRTFAINEGSAAVCLFEEGQTYYIIPAQGEQFISNGWLPLDGWQAGPASECNGHV